MAILPTTATSGEVDIKFSHVVVVVVVVVVEGGGGADDEDCTIAGDVKIMPCNVCRHTSSQAAKFIKTAYKTNIKVVK